VAQLYDAGWSEGGVPYLAMEVVDGLPIDRHCQEHQLDVRARVRLFLDVLRAAAYAHARLVVHRDLKPANVLVTREGRVKLLDFGIAKVLSSDEAGGADSDLTRSSGRPITLSYAAPEQVLGQPVTTATDIYTLGVMLFELLSGQKPFRAQADTRAAVAEAAARGDAPAPSALATVPATARALRGDLDLIVRKALRKDPDQRFETAAAFADDLERYLEGRAVQARPSSAWYRLRRFVGRNRIPVAAGALAGLALVAGLSVALWQARRAELQAQNAAAIGNFVLAVIQQADPDASQQTQASDLALLRTIEERIGKELPQRPDLRFALRLAVATAYRNRGEPKEAAALLRQALDDAAAAPDIAGLEVLRAKVLLGETSDDDAVRKQMLDGTIPSLRALGRPAAALLVDALLARTPSTRLKDPRADADLREALAVAKAQFGLADERTLKAASALAGMLGPGVLERNEEAVAVLEPVLRAVQAAGSLPAGNPMLLHAVSIYGQTLCKIDRCAEGVPLLERAVQTAIERHRDGKELRAALLYVARGQRLCGQTEAALATFTSIYALLASREPYAGRLRHYYGGDVAYSLLQARRPLEAEPFIDETQAFRDRLPAGETSLAAEVDFQVGFKRLGTRLRLGEYAAARTLGEAMLQRYRQDKSPYYEFVTNIFLSDVYLATGQLARAEEAARAALAYALAQGGTTDDQALHYGALARVLLARGDAAQAVAVTDKERDSSSASEASDPDLADFHLARGRALLALGRAAAARQPLARAHAFWMRFAPHSHAFDVATYWYAQALAAAGEGDAAQRLHPAARPPLDYPPPDRRLLETERRRPAEQRIAAVLHRYPLRPEIAALIAQGAAPAAR